MVALPSAMPSDVPGSPGGSIGLAPAARSVARKRAAPTRSSASTAGTLSDCCRARRTVTAP
jgi:hypothetical protein